MQSGSAGGRASVSYGRASTHREEAHVGSTAFRPRRYFQAMNRTPDDFDQAVSGRNMAPRRRRLMRQRGERIERSFAHMYDTGGMDRAHPCGHTNILTRLLIHAGGFNLGLIMRQMIGFGTPRRLQGRLTTRIATPLVLLEATRCGCS